MKKYNPVVTNEKQIDALNQHFYQAEAIVNQRIYNSKTDEKNRTIRLKRTRVFKGELEQASSVIQTILLQDLQPNLEPNQLITGDYFLSSEETNKLPIKVFQLKPEVISLVWFGPEGTKFQKTLVLKQLNKDHVKATYYDFVKGFKSMFGFRELRYKYLYLANQKIAFEMQMNEAMLQLTDDQKIQKKLLSKNQRYQEKLVKKG